MNLDNFGACFHHGEACKGSSSFLNPKFQPLAVFCARTGRFVSDLFRNHIVGFPTKCLIYSLHHKELKVSFFTDFYFAGGI